MCEKFNIEPKNIAYVGDDINDLEVIKMVGFGCCPSDAVSEVKQNVDYVAKAKGGEGVIREIADLIYSKNNK